MKIKFKLFIYDLFLNPLFEALGIVSLFWIFLPDTAEKFRYHFFVGLILVIVIRGVVILLDKNVIVVFPDGFAISVQEGDILDGHKNPIIGCPDTFDTEIGEIISADSLLGKFKLKVFESNYISLERQIDLALSNFIELSHISKPGMTKRYPLGTTIKVTDEKHDNYYLVAYSRFDSNNVANSSISDLSEALSRAWESLNSSLNMNQFSITLVGRGLARTPNFTALDSLLLITTSFVLRSKQGRFSEKMNVVIEPNSLSRADLFLYKKFLKSLARNT